MPVVSGAATVFQKIRLPAATKTCLPAPTLEDAHRRKWWLLITTILENLFFSQLLFGWASLVLMLKDEGFFFYLCESEHLNISKAAPNTSTVNHGHDTPVLHQNLVAEDNMQQQYVASNISAMRRLLSGGGIDTGTGCSEQDKILNIAYTVALFSQTGSGFFIGALMDKYGYKKIRLAGCFGFIVAHAVLIFVDKTMSGFVIPMIVLSALTGNTLMFTSLQVANLFGDKRGTVMGLLIGAMSSCAIMFSLFKNMYDAGMAISIMWAIIAAGGIWCFCNCLFTWPEEAIPVPPVLKSNLLLYKLIKGKTDPELPAQLQTVGQRMSHNEVVQWHDILTSRLDLTDDGKGGDNDYPTFTSVLKSGLFILGLMFACIVFLRLLLYIGIMHLALLKLTNIDTMMNYISIFGYLQLICLPTCPLLNWLLDRNTSQTHIEDANERTFSIKIQKLKNCGVVFAINSAILILFGVCVLVPVLEIQIFSFIAHTVIRGTGMSAVLGAFAVVFPFQFLGKVVGLAILCASLVDLSQSPLFILIESVFKGDPFWVDVMLFVLSFLNFILPVYLFLLVKRMLVQHIHSKENNDNDAVKQMAERGDPVARKVLIGMKEKEAFL